MDQEYVAPAVTILGSVAELTAGTVGLSTAEGLFTQRAVVRGS
jgi:hypothetical protein